MTGSIETIWPLFGIANQLLAVIALVCVTTVAINSGRARWAALTLLPMLFVIATTSTAAYQLVSRVFWTQMREGINNKNRLQAITGGLNALFILLMVSCVGLILLEAIYRWMKVLRQPKQLASPAAN
jgi:carbon starvation protein